MTGPLLAAQEIEAMLGLPPGWRMGMLVALGYPAEKPPPTSRKSTATVLRWVESDTRTGQAAPLDVARLAGLRSDAYKAYPQPEGTRGWQLSAFLPEVFLAFYDPLRMKRGYRLWLYENGGGGDNSTPTVCSPRIG